MKEERIIQSAKFNPKVCKYWLISGLIVSVLTIVGIPLMIIWVPLALLLTGKYLEHMECTLTARNLIVKKGMFTRIEKTIPLEKITDLGLVQGPIMRYFGIHTLSIETAGQSNVGALVSMTGILDVMAFRERVLEQRDELLEKQSNKNSKNDSPTSDSQKTLDDTQLLSEIKETLLRIEKHLQEK